MRVLVTAGNTLVPIDQVRCITNIFTGRTGTRLAIEGNRRGHEVVLLTSHPQLVGEQITRRVPWRVLPFQTFDDLHQLLAEQIPNGLFDAVIHCAAVADYKMEGIYTPQVGTQFDRTHGRWLGDNPALDEVSADKVKSSHQEVWFRLTPTPKLVDLFRKEWNYRGVLVKFKLEVGISEAELLWIAENSRQHSQADLMVANTLEGMNQLAYLGPLEGQYKKLNRSDLPRELWNAVEARVSQPFPKV